MRGGLPNALSLSRVLLALLFVPAGRATRIALICLAAATDFLDGWLARRTNTTTRWGALVIALVAVASAFAIADYTRAFVRAKS
jgi:phosphatidylglycerophosphate synthase